MCFEGGVNQLFFLGFLIFLIKVAPFSHMFSMGFRSGECEGQYVTLFSLRNLSNGSHHFKRNFDPSCQIIFLFSVLIREDKGLCHF